jgi:hypothetical protein
MDIDPEVFCFHMQAPLLEMAFDKGAIIGSKAAQ